MTDDMTYIIYAYEDDTWHPDTEVSDFPEAVNSDSVEDDDEDHTGTFVLPFLAEGTYDLVVADYDGNGNYSGFQFYDDVATVQSEQTATVNLEFQ